MRANPLASQNWVIEGGMIRTQAGRDRFRTDLRTVPEHSDFELRFEWKIFERGNAGVKYNVHGRVDKRQIPAGHVPATKSGHEAWSCRFRVSALRRLALGPLARRLGQIRDQCSDLIKWADEKPLKPGGELNASRFVVSGNHGEHWLNGEKLFEFEMGSQEMLASVDKTKFRTMAGYGLKGAGPIVLTHHGTPVWFRNLSIRAE